jgi:hypothetical protein
MIDDHPAFFAQKEKPRIEAELEIRFYTKHWGKDKKR